MSTLKFQMANFKWQMRPAAVRQGFSMVEILVVVSIFSVIVLALMAVFSGTQRAFRSTLTQTGVLEGGRATMDLITRDLRGLVPSDGAVNGAVNFLVADNGSYATPLVQSMPGGSSSRQNLLQEIFILNHYNNGWWGVAYAIGTNRQSASLATSLYRLQCPTNGSTVTDPSTLYTNQAVQSFFANPLTNGSHLIDGVVHFAVRAYSPAGYQINSAYTNAFPGKLSQTAFSTLQGNASGMQMYSNNLPAAVELQLGVLEDQVLAHALSLSAASSLSYLQGQSGAVHLFRQRVSIPNVDTTAY